MSEYREKRTVVEEVPFGSRPVVETRDSVVRERPAMSGGAIAALVLAAIATAVVITMMVLNSQQRDAEDQLAEERARTAAAQQTAQQQQPQQPQQPVVVTVPQPQTAVVPAPSPSPADIAPTSASIEIDISSKLLNDSELRSSIIDVKVVGGIASLSGHVATEELKRRAELIARTVKGVRNVTNDIVVQS